MKQHTEEQLVFVDNPLKWRMIGIVMISVATLLLIAMWRFGAELFGADTTLLTVVRVIVGLLALIGFVFGFSLVRLPVRTLSFDLRKRVLKVSEKGLVGGSTRDIPFARIAEVVVEEDDLENSVVHRCVILLDDDESIDIPTPESANAEVVGELRRDIAVFAGIEDE